MRSPKRMLAASVLACQSLVVFFAGLVAKDLSALGTGRALALASALALLCLLAAGLLRTAVGYALGWLVQALSVLAGVWVPAMFFLGAVFAGLWLWALIAGGRIERRQAALARDGG